MSDIQHLKIIWSADALRAEQERFLKLLSLAHAAKKLCEWTRHNEYPEKSTSEFMHLTELIDQLDTKVRQVFPTTSSGNAALPEATG